MNAGGFLHHDDLDAYESCLRDAAAWFPHDLRICEIGTWSGHSSRSVNAALNGFGVSAYEHWCVDNRIEANGCWEQPFPGALCVWKDSSEAAAEVSDNLGLVLVDGCHCLQHVLMDFALYAPKIRKGGLILFHDVNEKSQGTQYQNHGDRTRLESHISVRSALATLGLMPLLRGDWNRHIIGGTGETWWGQMAAFQKA